MKLHNAMWPGLVGKEPDTDHPPISLENMLDFTAHSQINGKKYDGVDLFIFHPHTDPDASAEQLEKMADFIASKDLKVGTLVAPVWAGTVGGSAFGSNEDRKNFVLAVEKTCRVASILNKHGVRQCGVIRVDSAGSTEDFAKDPLANTKKVAETFREAGKIAEQYGERIAAEGEICWGGLHSWKASLNTLESTGMPGIVGFQADLAHTYLYLMGYNSPEDSLLEEEYSQDEFWAAYKTMTDALRPWTIDFHVAQNDGSVHGTGSHDKTGRHGLPNDPNGKLDIAKCSAYWLEGATDRGIKHICWDGCMFDNAILENSATWNSILDAMIKVDKNYAV